MNWSSRGRVENDASECVFIRLTHTLACVKLSGCTSEGLTCITLDMIQADTTVKCILDYISETGRCMQECRRVSMLFWSCCFYFLFNYNCYTLLSGITVAQAIPLIATHFSIVWSVCICLSSVIVRIDFYSAIVPQRRSFTAADVMLPILLSLYHNVGGWGTLPDNKSLLEIRSWCIAVCTNSSTRVFSNLKHWIPLLCWAYNELPVNFKLNTPW